VLAHRLILGPTYPPNPATPPPVPQDLPNRNLRPPLADELFADRPLFADTLERFPECAPIVSMLRHLKDESLESVLEKLQTASKDYSRGRRQLAAVRCYIHQVISQTENEWRRVIKGITNYKTLLDQIERLQGSGEPVSLVTFNYDTLLEDALRLFGVPITSLDDYIKNQTIYRVFKLHGSLNWAHKIQTPEPINYGGNTDSVFAQIIEQWDEVRIAQTYIFSPNDVLGVASGVSSFPAIALPVTTKQTYECPEKMVEELACLVPKVTKVLVIGWRATEDHFLGILGNRLSGLRRGVPLHIVAGSEERAEETKVRIHRALLNNQPSSSIDSGGSTDFILSRRATQSSSTEYRQVPRVHQERAVEAPALKRGGKAKSTGRNACATCTHQNPLAFIKSPWMEQALRH
jgi:hypothetical protein